MVTEERPATASRPYLVVGGGPAAAAATRVLASCGAEVALVTAEDHLPYDRTHLSKQMLLTPGLDAPALWQDDETWVKNVQLQVRTRIAAVHPAGRTVTTNRGDTLHYRSLLLATGAEPRRLDLAGASGPGVHYLRDLRDACDLADTLRRVRNLAVIGGGVIGLEVAAAAASRGINVAVLEVGPRILGRGVPEPVARWIAAAHEGHGVTVRVDVVPTEITRSTSEEVTGVRLADGAEIPANGVVIGVGITPRDDLARDAGLLVDDGIVVDTRCRTSDPSIYAAGDVVRMRDGVGHRGVRLESYQAAQRQGDVAAHAMLGHDHEYHDVPWTWSDQYDATLQSAGLDRPDGDRLVCGGADAVLVLTLMHGRLVAACGVAPGNGIARAVKTAQSVIAAGCHVDRHALATAADLPAVTKILRAAAKTELG